MKALRSGFAALALTTLRASRHTWRSPRLRIEIEFEQPTALPFGLGYAAHFGLGLFAPVDP
jgi:hypothetical protein